MGSWKTEKGIIISDGYADALEKLADKGWEKLKKAYPKATKEQYAETMRFIMNRFSSYKEAQMCKKEEK